MVAKSSSPGSSSRQRNGVIQITGDVTVDWMLVVPTVVNTSALQVSYQWESRTPVQIIAQPGGASLLSALVSAASTNADVCGIAVPGKALADPSQDRLTRTFTVWQPYPSIVGSRDLTWRMHQFLGVQPSPTPDPIASSEPQDQVPDVLVIDDSNLGFRSRVDMWPRCLRDGREIPRHVLLKMSNPLGSGPLWERLAARCGDSLTFYCSVNDLRKEYAPVGQPLSWERTGSDVVAAVRGRSDLVRAARVIVSLGLSGAVIVERDGPSRLIFDPMHQEGDWERRRPGMPTGLGTCITAAITAEVADMPERPDWIGAVIAGLTAGRALHERRHVTPPGRADDGLHFPVDLITDIVTERDADSCFRNVEIPDDDDWRVFTAASGEDHRQVAQRVVVDGDAEACRDIPVERIGAWASIDRTEIESMRSVRNIIHEYLQHSHRTRPLSLAVFGPPGSGKSFAIKQMARESMNGATSIAILEFNLSQFASAADLPAALQRVRDCAVEQTLPLVFWDEFDTGYGGRELGWLAQFLAPMQDGVFLEGGIARPIGPAIFIFAGGTHATMGSFKHRAVEIPGAKATDFLSRLRGYVDILGPNPTHSGDPTYVLRRALLLRALLMQKAGGLFRRGHLDIDPGVLRAFLDVTTYVHGARSMESIVDMSALTGKLRYERSALPPQHQLSLHVDADEFLGLVT